MRTERSRIFIGFLAFVLAGTVAVAASAATPFVTIHPGHLPLSFGLPSGWQSTSASSGSAFDAVGPGGSAHLEIAVSRFNGAFADFAPIATAGIRSHYRAEDPKASVKGHVVTLPSGKALQITVRLTHGSPLALYLYVILHGHTAYQFTYYCAQSQASANRGTFDRSARSIKFKK